MRDSLADTIVAVATSWQLAPLGIVRLSGPQALNLLAAVRADTATQPPRPGTIAHVRLHAGRLGVVPAAALCFHAPHSYTGDDVVELHLPGSPPLLRAVCEMLIGLGARRARPGEFTARAYLNGRLDAAAVDAVAALIYAQDRATARQAARIARSGTAGLVPQLREQLLDLLARVEAGIDFADEHDVRFITTAELRDALETVRATLASLHRATRGELHGRRPHVALAGLPNAGKSTLFNALLGQRRAIVSPVVGTTRDVIEAELELDGLRCVLQDCAGLGSADSELELAAHLAAEQTARHADLVIWVHEARRPWQTAETQALGRIDAQRRLVVLSKIDAGRGQDPIPPIAESCVRVSARSGEGLESLKRRIVSALSRQGTSELLPATSDSLVAADAALQRAVELTHADDVDFEAELAALELRAALTALDDSGPTADPEQVLARIYSWFCVGK